MDYDPKFILLTCVYLATKTEECRISVEEFCKKLKMSSIDKLLQQEVILLQGIKFELLVYHPFRPLQGFLWDMADTLGIDTNTVKNQAHDELNALMSSDLPLLFSPSHLALAALAKVAKQTSNQALTQYITSTINQHAHEAQDTIASIVGSMEAISRPSADMVRTLDKKLKQCSTPPDLDLEARAVEAKRMEEKQMAKALQHAAQEKADLEFMTKPS